MRHTLTVNASVLGEKFSWDESSSSVDELLAGRRLYESVTALELFTFPPARLTRVAMRPLRRIPS
jgi:hypothetical protein